VSGWSFVPQWFRSPQRDAVLAYLDGTQVPLDEGAFLGGSVREDVVSALGVEGRSFHVALPVAPGEHVLCLSRGPWPGAAVPFTDADVLSCKSFTA
jgi:hypothetical protein